MQRSRHEPCRGSCTDALGKPGSVRLPAKDDFGFVGESLGGTWTLSITDSVKGNTHTLNSWSLTVAPVSAGGAASSALLAVDELFGSDGPAADAADLLADDLALALALA